MSIYYADDDLTLHLGDALDVTQTLPSASVDCIVTSPPYFGLRDYGVPGQLGAEPTVAEYVDNLVNLFRECRRVLTGDGTFWLNLGDTYKNKDLLMVPARVAIALQDDGWILRNDIIWHKPAGTPFAGKDRCGPRHEHVLFFTKKRSGYHYDLDAIKVATATATGRPQRARAEQLFREAGLTDAHLAAMRSFGMSDAGKARTVQTGTDRNTADVMTLAREAKAALGGYYREFLTSDRKNPGDVWTLAQQPFADAHFATFPSELPKRAILAGCKPGGTVLDPFSGSATTGMVALELGRSYIGVEINPEYHDLALDTRLRREQLTLGGAA